MTKIVRKALSDVRLSAKQERQLRKLAHRPDSEIDFSDIPELAEKFWRNGVRNPFRKGALSDSGGGRRRRERLWWGGA